VPRNIKTNLIEGFIKKYGVDKLVYYELYQDAETAIKSRANQKRALTLDHASSAE